MKLFDIAIVAVLVSLGAGFYLLRSPGGKGVQPVMDAANVGSKTKAESPVKSDVAYFAGGCFWGIEDRFQQVPGVISAVSGYMGGDSGDPTYKEVCSGASGHAETVRVTFDPQRSSFRTLLNWFFKFHDPTQLNRQGPDRGMQYRSAIFTASDEQLNVAKAFIAELSKDNRFSDREIVTQVAPAGPFFEAEEYHQDYHAKHGGSCALPDFSD
jgi:methionine-S-sulfoxide reductase